jgi:hypothetical protein
MNTASIKHLAIGIPIFLGLAASSLHATQVILDTTFGEGAGNVLDQPPFAPLRSGPRAASWPSRQKQIPSSQNATDR